MTTAPPSTTTSLAPTTTAAPPASSSLPAPTSTTLAPPSSGFPPVVNQAMEALQPPPSGMQAPDELPATAGAVSAEATKGLDGSYSVTLVATPRQLPVNSPALGSASANPRSLLGTFSTTPVASTAAATSYLETTAQQDLASCSGPKATVSLTGTAATACSTSSGAAISWALGPWKVQVLDEGGSTEPTSQADVLASWLASHSLPAAAQGVVSVSLPASTAVGTSVTSEVIWYYGRDVYQVSAPGSVLAAVELAASMRPWPGG